MSEAIEPAHPVAPVAPVPPLRIGLVAEGATEWEVIDSALKAIFPSRPYVLTRLQPDATRPEMGQGWGGVLKWCQQVAERTPAGGRTVEADPTLSLFDAVLLQLDADVATLRYDQLSAQFDDAEVARRGWHPIPCITACPPAAVSADPLRAVLLSWLQPATQGPGTVVCLPAMNTGAWQAAAMLPAGHALLPDLECRADIEARLALLPLALRVVKGKRASRLRAAAEVEKRWADVTARCTRAAEFDRDIRTALP